MFLIDGSTIDNTTNAKLNATLQFIKEVISAFKIGRVNARFAVVAYTLDVKVIYGFKPEYSLMDDFENAFDCMKFPPEVSYTGHGLQLTEVALFGMQNQPDRHKVLVVIAGAPSFDDVIQPSLSLQNMGVKIFGIGVGENVDENQLNEIASDPDNLHVFVSPADALQSLVDKIVKEICQSKYTFYLYTFIFRPDNLE